MMPVVWSLLVLSVLLAGIFIYIRRHRNVPTVIPRYPAKDILTEIETRFQVLVESAPVGIVITSNSRIVYANPTFLEMFGDTFSEALGTLTVEKVAPESRDLFAENLQKQAEGHRVRYEIMGLRRDGSKFPIQVAATRITNFSEEITAIGFIQDISERRDAEEKLQFQNERLSALHNITLDLLNRRGADDVLNAILLRACDLLDSPFGVLSLLEDDVLVVKTTSEMNTALLGTRIPLKDARLSMLAINTRQPQVRQDYSQWAERLAMYAPYNLKAVVNVPVIINDQPVGILALGRTAPDKPFLNDEIDVMRSLVQLAALAMDNAQLFAAAQHELNERKSAEEELRRANQKLQFQIEAIQLLQTELREQAIRDPLTGLYNRRYLDETLERELARAGRENYPISFVMIDIDGFKKINDDFGHGVGDAMLQRLANQLLSQTRTGDIVCRYGGDEFLVVLLNVASEISFHIADKWRNQFQSPMALLDSQAARTTISCGISDFPGDGTTKADIIANADNALYIAKRNGRDQVVVWAGNREP